MGRLTAIRRLELFASEVLLMSLHVLRNFEFRVEFFALLIFFFLLYNRWPACPQVCGEFVFSSRVKIATR